MDYLKTTYGFGDGNRISVRAAAKNNFGGSDPNTGWGQFSTARDTTFIQPEKPYQLGKPYVVMKTINTLDLAWPLYISSYNNDDGLDDVEYEIQWDTVGDPAVDNFTQLPGIKSITKNPAIHLTESDGLNQMTLFKFRVRALTTCGPGEWSASKAVQLMAKPSKMDPVCGKIKFGTSILYEWPTHPDGEFSATKTAGVKEYKLEIMNDVSDWIEYTHCPEDTFADHSCLVQSEILAAAPYNLEYLEPVKARVSGRNDSGYGEPSD
jgi:hypothetical protein